MKRSVVVWGAGAIAMRGLRALIDHRDYELVGLHAWGLDKVSRDAGDIAGVNVNTGAIATDDQARLVALKSDCLVFQGNYAQREAACVAEVVPLLEAGINVVGPSMMDPIAPKHGRPEYVEPIEAACGKGSASTFCGGIDPGYMMIGGSCASWTRCHPSREACGVDCRTTVLELRRTYDRGGKRPGDRRSRHPVSMRQDGELQSSDPREDCESGARAFLANRL
jgi:hypothetical protein